ncbi:MAG: hypothetical protein HY423_02500, partial [Candidatus Lambdaproteobacteria bacterium]|nr:hypothetical protein [Candidatus Lambdaproteobacteria bacterium]
MQGENPVGEPSPAALLARAQSRIDARRPLVLSGVRGGAKAWLIAALAERMALAHGKALAAGGAAPAGVARPLVVLTASHERAEALQQELAWFGGAGLARLYPPWDTVPYDNFSPQKETMAERLATLAALREGRCRVLVTTPQAAMQAAMPPEVFERLRFRLEVGGRYPRAGLVARLVEAGYVRVELVEAPGEFSARGEVVDIFPIQLDRPVRLDFFDDELESLRPFDVDTQRSHDDL